MNEKLGNPIDFCKFLVDRGLLDTGQAEAVRYRSAGERTAIGQVLVMRGVLTVRQVMNVLSLQADLPDVRFGELALRAGYLTTVELEEALKFQAAHRRHQIAVVTQDGQLERPELEAAVVAYVHFLELQA
ncbi:MAG: hypothetical protein KUG77_16080 [Nannocystaceae bacterium]|nr:hypothetical protein [Nannocystaceae bacterium]